MRCETKDVMPSSYEYIGVQCSSTNFKFVNRMEVTNKMRPCSRIYYSNVS